MNRRIKGFRKFIAGAIFLINANVLLFLISDINKLQTMFTFMTFLAGIIIAGNVGEHIASKVGTKSTQDEDINK